MAVVSSKDGFVAMLLAMTWKQCLIDDQEFVRNVRRGVARTGESTDNLFTFIHNKFTT